MSSTHKISVCMAMRDAASYLRECIDSILSQTFSDFELLIADDGSTDDSADIARSYSDPRIRLIPLPHDFTASLNALLREASGQYIARMDADDIMHPDRLRVQLEYLETHPDAVAVCSNAIRIDCRGNAIGQIGCGDSILRITPRMMCECNHVCNPSTMMRRDIVSRHGLYYEKEFEFAEDYRFWSRVVAECGPIDCLPQQLLRYRVSDSQVTATHYAEMMHASERIKSSLAASLAAKANPGYADPEIKGSDRQLTLIIPFLNEGEEVENTIRSVREFGGDRIEIFAINDCSYDSYPYMERLGSIPGVTYILNRKRLGVAGCRDKGAALCRTPYFLLLDAHMRAYDDSWLTEIPRLLREDDRRILCCQGNALEKTPAGVAPSETATHYGARMIISRRPPVPGIDWIDEDFEPAVDTAPIPAVLGAGYAATPRYWRSIGGLKGLSQYGCDEQFISLKAWLDGGECLLLKKAVLGHIYRKSMPYGVDRATPMFNNLLVTETLFPLRERIMARAAAYAADKQRFAEAFQRLRAYLESNPDLRKEYPCHRQRCDRFIRFNSRPSAVERKIKEDIGSRIDEIRDAAAAIPAGPGLFEGKIGRALWLFHYARHAHDSDMRSLAKGLVESVAESLPLGDISFGSGLSGIGWALIYMSGQGFIDAPAHALSAIDRSMPASIHGVSDTSFEHGTAGILAYACARAATDARGFISGNQDLFDSMAAKALEAATDPVAAYYAMLWLHLSRCGFKNPPALYLTDWINPSGFVARDKRFWSMSMRDGVTASAIYIFTTD